MSLIVHRCLKCRKPDYWRNGRTAAGRTVGGEQPDKKDTRTCHGSAWGDPELAPTFNDAGQREREAFFATVAPGWTA